MILIVDNYDSFTYNLAQYVGMCGEDLLVRRNDEITPEEVLAMKPGGIMFSPGPCTPNEAGVCRDIGRLVLQQAEGFTMPLFGVCLGHQTLGDLQGTPVVQAQRMMHGKASLVEHAGKGLFEGMPNPFSAIRYHSLTIPKGAELKGFEVTAHSQGDEEIMGIRHESLPIHGVQFHPESAMTEQGFRIVENFVRIVQAHAA